MMAASVRYRYTGNFGVVWIRSHSIRELGLSKSVCFLHACCHSGLISWRGSVKLQDILTVGILEVYTTWASTD